MKCWMHEKHTEFTWKSTVLNWTMKKVKWTNKRETKNEMQQRIELNGWPKYEEKNDHDLAQQHYYGGDRHRMCYYGYTFGLFCCIQMRWKKRKHIKKLLHTNKMITWTRTPHIAMCECACDACLLSQSFALCLSFFSFVRMYVRVCMRLIFVHSFKVSFTHLLLSSRRYGYVSQWAGSTLVLLLLFKQLHSYFYTFFPSWLCCLGCACILCRAQKFIQSGIVCWFRFVEFSTNESWEFHGYCVNVMHSFVVLFPLLRLLLHSPGVGHLVRLLNARS